MASSISTSRTRLSLPDDILIEIFSRFPLNSIYKFRCLSKVWLSNLSNPNFITQWFGINNKSLPWIHYHSILDDFSYESPLRFRNAYLESHSDFIWRDENSFSFKFLRYQKPFQGARKFYPLGSSNGFVLCASVNHYQRIRYHVCNPLTQKWVSLPECPRFSPGGLDASGILCGYSSLNSYKVVRLPKFEYPEKEFIVDVFSSDLGVWESFQVSCDKDVLRWERYNHNHNNVVILDGLLYFIEGLNSYRMLVYSLNQHNGSDGHRCNLIDLPIEENVFDHIIGESEGCVCYASASITGGEMTVSVWVLSEFSWKILHNDVSVGDMLAELGSRMDEIARIQVLGFSPVDRNVVLLGCDDWVRGFNIETRSFEELRLVKRDVYYTGEMHFPFVLKPMPTELPPPSWIDT